MRMLLLLLYIALRCFHSVAEDVAVVVLVESYEIRTAHL